MRLISMLGLMLVVILFSCGDNATTTSQVENDQVLADTSLSEQELAFKTINDQLVNNINDAGLFLKRARLHKQYGDLDAAINDVDRAIKIDSIYPEFYLLKAELYKYQGKYQESKDALDKCMFIDNDNVPARVQLGWMALITQDYEQALDYADAALKLDLYSSEAYFLKGMIFQEKKDTAKAISSFKTAVEQENDYYEAYIQLGLLHYNEPNGIAKEYFKNALRVKPKSLEGLYNYAIYCQDNGEYNEAIETYYEILSIQKYREPYFNLGYIHQEYLKVYDVAIENYTRAIEIEPSYYDAYYNRGLCFEEIDENKKAEADFRKTLSINPTHTYAALALERVLKNS